MPFMKNLFSIFAQLALGSLAFLFPSGLQAGEIPNGYTLQYEQDFQKPESLKDFLFTDPTAWKLSKDGDNSSLELFGKSKYEPKHRSPFNIALLADRIFGNFVLDVELQSTVKPYPHQDMCLFFGFQATN
jgi:hypothetical protein